jgi:carbon starvation protein
MLWLPMGAIFAVTLTALSLTIFRIFATIANGTFDPSKDLLQLLFGVLLFALGIMVAVQGIKKLTEKTTGEVQTA